MADKFKYPIGIFGGTFDPIHFGHLRTALVILETLNLQEIRFIPCHIPVLKSQTQATVSHRLAMLKLAIQHQPGFIIDERELHRNSPSYTFETLTSIRNEVGKQPLCLIIGSDAFNELDRWHRWQELITLAHLIVVTRKTILRKLPDNVAHILKTHETQDITLLHQTSAGHIFRMALPLLEISATDIRHQISAGLNSRFLLPENVLRYIQKEKIYIES